MSQLNIQLHGKSIGTLTLLYGDKSILAFNDEYIEDPDRDTLSLSFKNRSQELITSFRTTGPALNPFFSNLLPEGPLRDFLASKMEVKSVREFQLLWGLGKDLPGAISIHPSNGEDLPPLIEGDEAAPERRTDALRFSLAGVQLKFSAIKAEEKLTIPAKGIGGEWIVKLPSARFDSVPENEYSFMKIAEKIGIDVPETMLIEANEVQGIPEGLGRLRDERAFAIKRFDRSGDGPVHIEDFAQVFNLRPDDKYGKKSYRNIAQVIGIEANISDVEEFIRRLVFSTLIGNEDMHLKNWSLIYHDRRRANLSPAYDLLSTIPYIQSGNAALKYVSTTKMSEFNLEEIENLADKALIPRKLAVETAKETVTRFMEVWANEKNHLFITDLIIEKIEEHLKTLKIVGEL